MTTTKGFFERLYERRRRELIPVETVIAWFDDEIANTQTVKEQLLARLTLKLRTLSPETRTSVLQLTAEPLDDYIRKLEERRAEYAQAASSKDGGPKR